MKKILLVLLLLSNTIITKADTEDFQIWIPVNINAKFGEHLRGFLEVQPRIGNNAQDLGIAIVRPAIGWSIDKHWTIWGGYLMQSTLNKDNDYDIENRSWEGLTFKDTYHNITYEVRNRLEQRFVPYKSDISHRWRTRLRAEYVFSGQKNWSVISSEEIFINLNDQDHNTSIRAGENQNRAYVGVGYRFNPMFQVETGYLNQYNFNHGKPNQSNNVWMSNINVNF